MRTNLGVSAGSVGYQVFMLCLCLLAVVFLGLQTARRVDAETAAILNYADNAICAIFLFDFLLSLYRAPDRARYLTTWGWLDLLSSFPMVDALRWGRLARVARVFRVLRGVRATRLLARMVLERRAENAFLAAALVALLLLVLSSIAILHFEAGAGGNIETAEDALWWAFTTITTVGYGDRFPVTTEGRIVAVGLMCAGVALFGTFSAFLAAWFIGSDQTPKEDDVKALREEIALLRRDLMLRESATRV